MNHTVQEVEIINILQSRVLIGPYPTGNRWNGDLHNTCTSKLNAFIDIEI